MTATHTIKSAWRMIESHGSERLRRAPAATSTRARTAGAATTLIRHLLLGVLELQHRQADDHDHEDHRLRGRRAEVEPDEAVVPQLVDHDLRRAAGAALRHRVDDAERVEEGEDHVD